MTNIYGGFKIKYLKGVTIVTKAVMYHVMMTKYGMLQKYTVVGVESLEHL